MTVMDLPTEHQEVSRLTMPRQLSLSLGDEMGADVAVIRRVESEAERQELIAVLKRSFSTVAQDFRLTEINAPSNPAFTTVEKARRYMEEPIETFGLFYREQMIGCVSIAPSKNHADMYYIERLGVVPEERHRGHGDALLKYALDRIVDKGGLVASLGMMDINEKLKRWYLSKGFTETGRRSFSHLPFEVCFMSRTLVRRAREER